MPRQTATPPHLVSKPSLPGVLEGGGARVAAERHGPVERSRPFRPARALSPSVTPRTLARGPVSAMRALALAIGPAVMVAGCAQRPTPPAVSHPHAARVRPRTPAADWFHQQLAAARAARRNHQPRTDTAGAQRAYDDIVRAACVRVALAGPDEYPARCEAILRRTPDQSPANPFACEGDAGDPLAESACSD
jgi:hypothetical protein